MSPYASSKLMNELLGKNLSHLYQDMNIVGLRFFNLFGPWQDPKGDYAAVIPKWIDLCLKDQRPVIFGDGSATRDFCSIQNVTQVIQNILKEDSESKQIVNSDGDTVNVPPNCTDAHLTPYHVERSQLFLRERNWSEKIDLELICDYVKNTEFPIPKNRLIENIDAKTIEMSRLVTSADLIGQLADPGYYRKIPALYYEFEETGANLRLGYSGPADLKKSYPAFFYNYVRPHISKALEYLNATNDGRTWVSNLNFHVFCEEHRAILSEEGMSLLQTISKKRTIEVIPESF